ncbi:MAG TPA: hypothetical protein VF928_10550 [Usitatibacteraceae bacterium]
MTLKKAPDSAPQIHLQFLDRALHVFSADPRIAGVAIGGSWLSDSMDEFSDLDLVIATSAEAHAAVLADGRKLATSLGNLLSAFSGEHVHEPRLLICLYDAPLLHVDLKFVALPDLAARVEDPEVLWERNKRMTRALQNGKAHYPAPDAQWIEDRFWVWLHYGAAKIARSELFEAMAMLSYLRVHVLGPLGLRQAGATPSGVRKIEQLAPVFAARLVDTVGGHDARDCARALAACAALYRTLRMQAPGHEGLVQRAATETAASDYLATITRALR